LLIADCSLRILKGEFSMGNSQLRVLKGEFSRNNRQFFALVR
jgi:hypothetical protein